MTAMDGPGAAARWNGTRLGLRIRTDVRLLLSVAVALPVVAMEGISDNPQRLGGLLGPVIFVAAQLWLSTIRAAPSWLPTARLAA